MDTIVPNKTLPTATILDLSHHRIQPQIDVKGGVRNDVLSIYGTTMQELIKLCDKEAKKNNQITKTVARNEIWYQNFYPKKIGI